MILTATTARLAVYLHGGDELLDILSVITLITALPTAGVIYAWLSARKSALGLVATYLSVILSLWGIGFAVKGGTGILIVAFSLGMLLPWSLFGILGINWFGYPALYVMLLLGMMVNAACLYIAAKFAQTRRR